jgi:hypothetical protein
MMRLLAAICVLLLAVIAAEVWSADGDVGVTMAAVPTGDAERSNPRTADRSRGEGLKDEGPVDEWVAEILARPLFAPHRRQDGTSRVAAESGLPRLAAIIASPGATVAIFQPTGGVKPLVAQDGATVAGWQVKQVAADGVLLQRANATIVMKPQFENAGQTTGTAPVRAQPARSQGEAAPPSGLLRARLTNPQLQP